MMAGAVERHLQILEDLLAGPGPRILLPAIGQSGEILGIAHRSHKIEEPSILAGETIIDEQCRRLAFVSIHAHHPLRTEIELPIGWRRRQADLASQYGTTGECRLSIRRRKG